MVLWEITLATAYFLGLKRTYRHALRIQRRIILPNHSKTRQLVHCRTRAVFDMAIKFHKSIQDMNIKVAPLNLGNFIKPWLEQMKQSTKIHSELPTNNNSASSRVRMTQHVSNISIRKTPNYYRVFKRDTHKNLFSTNSFPVIARIMRPPNLDWSTTHCRHFSNNNGGVIRKDIMQWMLQK